MATITLTLSARTNKDTGKAEILLRYRNTREVALRAHTRVFILPKYLAMFEEIIERDGKSFRRFEEITAQEAEAIIRSNQNE